ncbi:DUF4809 family protein [Enterococcus termitis]|uniref:DUF4809 domain-containing protein n=1 Tax=Enterococcus termitis TaxID=332950 RepID=A0A1E5H4T0_9ENTE|nr:DUF4809 family protein [Enterococcus termitis]OEG19923.1 DUF4809 domain-containing protein [Enterococcus termitis]OJG97709.1 hypothetical protein RV18_GL000526 [Enterococcus termitis]
MKNATISKTVDLLDGGCNVCGIIENENYTLVIDEQALSLDELTVSSLITAIVLKEGFKRTYETDVIDDFTLYTKDEEQIRLKEEYDCLTYSNKTEQIKTNDYFMDKKALLEKVNEILTTIFQLEKINFQL